MVSKRRFLDATQEFSNHYISFLRSLAVLYPEIFADGPEFMRLFKIPGSVQAKHNDKSTEKTTIVDEIARQVLKTIYDLIELRLAKIKEDELNLKMDSVNDDLERTKPVEIPITTVSGSKNPPNSEEERITNKLERTGTAYDSRDGRKAYNLGEERIIIYNLGEERQPKNKEAERNAIDLGDEKNAHVLREENIDKILEQERKTYYLGDGETADNLGEGENTDNLGDKGTFDNLGEERKVKVSPERRKAYESREDRIDSILEEERKVYSLEEGEILTI